MAIRARNNKQTHRRAVSRSCAAMAKLKLSHPLTWHFHLVLKHDETDFKGKTENPSTYAMLY